MLEQKLENNASLAINKWYLLVQKGEIKQARHEAQLMINRCRRILKGRSKALEYRNLAFILGILFRGLQDFNDLSEITNLPYWATSTTHVEEAWTQICNCKERIKFSSTYFPNIYLSWVLDRIKVLKKVVDAEFGQGFYLSVGLLTERMICNICKKDFRSCIHIESWVYNGKLCNPQPQNQVVEEISIVLYPEDLRCRIWPWQMKNDGTFEGYAATSFRLDDFIDGSD